MIEFVKKTPWRKKASIPKGLRLYAVGDVHGRADALRNLFGRIDHDLRTRPAPRSAEIFLGDYVDRGPGTREVLDLLISRSSSHETLLLKGNHETMLLDFLGNPSFLKSWRQQGGLPTLVSYGLKPSLNPTDNEQDELARELSRVLPSGHRKLLSTLMSSFRCGDFFFVHAGVRPGVPLSEQKEDDLLWIRDDFLLHERAFEKIIVHGHTPVAEPDLRSNRINLDTGAYATGKLTCMVIEGETVGFV